MALARCEIHVPKPGKTTYVRSVPAAGKGLVCGHEGCFNDALVWLNHSEAKEYEAGETIFQPDSATAKFRVQKFTKA